MFKYVLMSMYFKLFIGFFRKLKKQATTTYYNSQKFPEKGKY